jgi:hypothetical protein
METTKVVSPLDEGRTFFENLRFGRGVQYEFGPLRTINLVEKAFFCHPERSEGSAFAFVVGCLQRAGFGGCPTLAFLGWVSGFTS